MTTNKTLSLVIAVLVVVIAALFVWVLVPTPAEAPEQEQVLAPKDEPTEQPTEGSDEPYYFIAIHNEPHAVAGNSDAEIEHEFENLVSMVELADEQSVKLTFMFTPQWVDLILDDPRRAQLLEDWEADGHEIGGHHHSTNHGTWDGYSPLSEEDSIKARIAQGKEVIESYLGDMDDYATQLMRLNPDFQSGCMNDDKNKDDLPDVVIYDTCSGFSVISNQLVETMDNEGAFVGENQHIISAPVNGIQRYWLKHYLASNPQKAFGAADHLSDMDGGVYGLVIHSTDNNQQAYAAFMKELKEIDPDGSQSITLSDVFENDMLPLFEVTEEEIRS